MDTLLARPTGKKQLLRKTPRMPKIFPGEQKTDSLAAKMTALNAAGQYSDHDLALFFEIPMEHRIDPFEITEDGDVFYADQRNVAQLREDIKQAERDIREGRVTVLKNKAERDAFFASLTTTSSS